MYFALWTTKSRDLPMDSVCEGVDLTKRIANNVSFLISTQNTHGTQTINHHYLNN